MSNTLNHKCPNCDAVLKFNPESQNWTCEYCKSKFNLNDLNKVLENLSIENSNELDVYICNNCGAEIITDANTSSTSCIYCKNTAILKSKLVGEFAPDYLIPFKTTKEDAIKAFKKLCKGKWFMPRNFNIKKNIKEISGIYVPFWIYDYESSGIVNFECDKVSTWKSSGYKYIKTDKYNVVRGGNVSFSNIPVDGSKTIKNNIMNSIEPFDYKDMKEFNYSYLSGFLSEKYDMTKEESIKEAQDRAKTSFIDEMMKDVKSYDNVNEIDNSINLQNTKSSYVLLPIWFLNINYKNKIYTFAMNGQTGKIKGNIPIDIKKVVLTWILLFILIFVLLFGINILKVIL